ncbi:restriction endonuclease subunit S [Treponema berlinense]|uniref:restriction endonuclease subunit S n=1 Tax=Treponema berlinense TaxID=225004 RepID=UPI003FD6EDFE
MKEKYRFSDLIEKVTEFNTKKEFGLNDIVGVTIEKGLIPTVANLTQTSLDDFYIVRPNTFIYNPRTHGVRLGMGFNKTEKTYITSWNNIAFKVKDSAKDIVLADYLWMYFNRNDWDRQTNFLAWGSSTIVFAWNDFLNIKINIPSITEQQKLVDAYNAIENRIQIKKKINEKLEETAQCLFSNYFGEYNKFYENKDELKELPNGWKYAFVKDFCKDNIESISNNTTLKKILYLDTGSITNNKIEVLQDISMEDSPSRAKRIVKNGDIVFSTVRPNLRHFGIIRNPADNFIASTGFSVLNNNSEKISNEFLYMWISSDAVLNYLQSIAENSVSTYPSINSSDLMDIKIIIPSDEILSTFGNFLKKTFIKIDDNNKELQHLTQLKQLLITRLSGM